MNLDEQFMRIALEEARKAADLGEVPVGACIVRDGKVIAVGHNLRETCRTALGHAELAAIESACQVLGGWRLEGCTIYVTLEPCTMCAGAIINSRMDRVVYGARDEKTGAFGSVCNLAAMPLGHSPRITLGVLEAECTELLQTFFETLRKES